jgi:hypothetical protein
MWDILEPKVEEGAEDWMKLLQEELHGLYSSLYYPGDQTKENERGRATWYIQGFGEDA